MASWKFRLHDESFADSKNVLFLLVESMLTAIVVTEIPTGISYSLNSDFSAGEALVLLIFFYKESYPLDIFSNLY